MFIDGQSEPSITFLTSFLRRSSFRLLLVFPSSLYFRNTNNNITAQFAVQVAKAASGLFITWGYTELCLYVVMLETGHVRISVILDEVRRSTSTQNRNQQRLDKYILVSYEGKGIAML